MNLIILPDFQSFAVNEDKYQNLSIWRFLLRSGYAILVKIGKWLKLLNSVPFIKKTLGNHLYIWIWSSCLTFRNSVPFIKKTLGNHLYIWIWSSCLTFRNSVPFIKKTLGNHLYIWIWSSCLTFRALPWLKTNFKISHFEELC